MESVNGLDISTVDYDVLIAAWVIVSLVLYVVALLVFLILLLLQIDFIATLNWALVLMFVVL